MTPLLLTHIAWDESRMLPHLPHLLVPCGDDGPRLVLNLREGQTHLWHELRRAGRVRVSSLAGRCRLGCCSCQKNDGGDVDPQPSSLSTARV